MQTHFDDAQLAEPNIADCEKALRKCVHCGFCSATCPTYVVSGDELDSPRGRIQLIQNMLESGEAPTKETVHHLDRCLSCLGCKTTCPSDVNYDQLIDEARAHIEKTFERPPLDKFVRRLLAYLLPRPNLFRAAILFGKLGRPVRQWLPTSFQAMMDLVPDKWPAPRLSDYGTVYPADGECTSRVIMLRGCVQSVMDQDTNDAAIRILNRHGVEVLIPAGSGCCGALPHHMGQPEAAEMWAMKNAVAWSKGNVLNQVDHIIATASGCGSVLKDYDRIFRSNPELAESAKMIAEKSIDIVEMLDKLDLKHVSLPRRFKVAYHGACSLRHGQGIDDLPRKLLTNAGYDIVDIPDGHLCCGSAGTYNILQPEMSQTLAKKKVSNIRKLNPDLVVTANVGCSVQLGSRMDIGVGHTVQFLDWATGGPRPKQAGGP